MTIVEETGTLMHILSDNAARLQSDTLEKLQKVISDKKGLRKHYSEQRNRLDLEFYKVCTISESFIIFCFESIF